MVTNTLLWSLVSGFKFPRGRETVIWAPAMSTNNILRRSIYTIHFKLNRQASARNKRMQINTFQLQKQIKTNQSLATIFQNTKQSLLFGRREKCMLIFFYLFGNPRSCREKDIIWRDVFKDKRSKLSFGKKIIGK